MADTLKFPNGGYDVIVLKRKDIIDCIDDNIIDKDIALELVEKCELDASKFINEGRWTGIPYIGNIRVPKAKMMEQSESQQNLIEEAKELLDSNQYILFRKALNAENSRRVKFQRHFDYMTSISVNKNRKLYKHICETIGEGFAKVYMFSLNYITIANSDFINIDGNE